MKLNETADEFENVKATNAVEKFTVAAQRRIALSHQIELLDSYIEKYRDKLQANLYTDISDYQMEPEHKAKGCVPFDTVSDRGTPLVKLYNNLSQNEIAALTRLFQREKVLKIAFRTLDKTLTTLKRNAAKETGTFVSGDLRSKLESDMGREIKQQIQTIGGNTIKIGNMQARSRTVRGDTHIYIQLDGATPEVLSTKAKEKEWKKTLDHLKEELHKWFVYIGLDKDSRMSWGWDYDYGPAATTKKNGGTFEVRLLTNLITARYKKLGKW